MSEIPDAENAVIAAAEELALAGKYDEALKKYEEAAGDDPYNPVIAVGISAILKAQGKYLDCAKEIEKAIDGLASWNVAKEDVARFNAFAAMLHVLCAEAYLYAEEREYVYRELDVADSIRAADAASLLVRAHAHAQAKEWNDAGNLLYRAEEWCFLHEDSMLTQVWIAKVQCAKEAGGIFAPSYAAEVYAKKTWRMPKGTATELLERAGNLRKEGLLYDALRYYDACLDAQPENRAHVLFLKGVVMEQLKRFHDAFGCYSDALGASPTRDEEFAIRVRWANAKALKEVIQ